MPCPGTVTDRAMPCPGTVSEEPDAPLPLGAALPPPGTTLRLAPAPEDGVSLDMAPIILLLLGTVTEADVCLPAAHAGCVADGAELELLKLPLEGATKELPESCPGAAPPSLWRRKFPASQDSSRPSPPLKAALMPGPVPLWGDAIAPCETALRRSSWTRSASSRRRCLSSTGSDPRSLTPNEPRRWAMRKAASGGATMGGAETVAAAPCGTCVGRGVTMPPMPSPSRPSDANCGAAGVAGV